MRVHCLFSEAAGMSPPAARLFCGQLENPRGPAFASQLSPLHCAEGIFLHLIWETGVTYDNKYHCCCMVPLRCLCVCGCVLCIVEASARTENTIISKSIRLAQISLFCSKIVAQLITNSTVFTA